MTALPRHSLLRRLPGIREVILLLLAVLTGTRLTAQTAVAWGSNQYGEATVPPGLTGVWSTAAGHRYSVVLKTDGTLRAWGSLYGSPLTLAPGITNVVALQPGLAVKSDGTVIPVFSHGLQVPPGLSNVVSLATDPNGTNWLALKRDGSVVQWPNDNAPPGLFGVVAVAIGHYHGMALKSDGTVVTWGDYTPPAGLNGVVAIAAGSNHALALKSNGAVVGWGLGYDSPGNTISPSGNVGIATGTDRNVLIREDGSVLVSGGQTLSGIPQPPGLTGVVQASASYDHILTVKADNDAAPPAILSPRMAVATAGYGSFHYRIRSAPPATSWSATGLPPGLSVDPLTGVISGSVTVPGTWQVTLGASGSNGSTTASLTIFANGAPAFIRSTLPAVWTVGLPPQGQAYATNHAAYSATGLPPGVGIDSSTGALTGAPQTRGVFPVTFRFTNTFGFIEKSFTFEVGSVAQWSRAPGGQSGRTDRYPLPAGLGDVRALALADFHALALRHDGTVVAWGENPTPAIQVPPGLNNVVAIATCYSHSLALKADGTVVGWGSSFWGGEQVPPGLTGVVAISCRDDHSMALRRDGTVVGWGRDEGGRTLPPDLSGVVAIADLPDYYSFVLKSDGSLIQLGSGLVVRTGVASFSAGVSHLLARKFDGTLTGYALSGGSGGSFNEVIPPPGLQGSSVISAGYQYSRVVKADGTIHSWGRNNFGQLDLPPGLTRAAVLMDYMTSAAIVSTPGGGVPRIVSPLRALATGGYGSFYYRIAAVEGATSFSATGLPAGLTLNTTTGEITGMPTVSGTFNVTLSATNAFGAGTQTLVLTVTGAPEFVTASLPEVWSLGITPPGRVVASNSPAYSATGLPPGTSMNSDGTITGAPMTLGRFPVRFSFTNSFGTDFRDFIFETSPVASWRRPPPSPYSEYSELTLHTPPPGLLNGVKAVAAGGSHTIVLKSDGTVAGWRWLTPPLPIPPGLTNVTAIAAGSGHGMALKSDGSVVSWGLPNEFPVVPAGLSGVTAISAGASYSVAVGQGGAMTAWGISNLVTSHPAGVTGVTAMDAGETHAVAWKNDGTSVMWGYSFSGATSPPPVGLSGVQALSAGLGYTLALKTDGTIVGWPAVVVVPAGLSGVTAIAAGSGWALALKNDGTLTAWGAMTVPPFLRGVKAISGKYNHAVALVSPLELTVPPLAVGLAGQPLTFPFTASWPAGAWSAAGLPPGLTIHPDTGAVSGTVLAPGVFRATVSYTLNGYTLSSPLTVLITTAPYAQWRSFWYPGGISAGAPLADPDADGVSNIFEYIAGNDPGRFSPGVLTSSLDPQGHLVITMDVVDGVQNEMTIRAVFAGDPALTLAVMENAGVSTLTGAPPGMRRWTFTDPAPSGARRFAAVRVTLN